MQLFEMKVLKPSRYSTRICDKILAQLLSDCAVCDDIYTVVKTPENIRF